MKIDIKYFLIIIALNVCGLIIFYDTVHGSHKVTTTLTHLNLGGSSLSDMVKPSSPSPSVLASHTNDAVNAAPNSIRLSPPPPTAEATVIVPQRSVSNTISTTSSSTYSTEPIIDIHRNENHLHPGWADMIKNVPAAVNGAKSNTISFKLLTAARKYKFWFAVEETLHSADFIEQLEQPTVKFFVQTLDQQIASSNSAVSVPVGTSSSTNPSSDVDAPPCLVLDVGSNGGYFSLLSRTAGCKVLAVDAQPWCLARLSSAAQVNGFTTMFSTRWGAVSSDASMTIEVGATKCSGLWSVKDSGWINDESSSKTTVRSIPATTLVLDWLKPTTTSTTETARTTTVIDEEEEIKTLPVISIFKIDAEGSELNIIQSALLLFKHHKIQHVVVEFVPARINALTSYEKASEVVISLYTYGYKFYPHFDTGTKLYIGAKSLGDILEFLNPLNKNKGRGAPENYRISLSL